MVKGGDFIQVQRFSVATSAGISATGQPVKALTTVAVHECDLQYDSSDMTYPKQGQTVQIERVAFIDGVQDIQEKDVITDLTTGRIYKCHEVKKGKMLPHTEVDLVNPV